MTRSRSRSLAATRHRYLPPLFPFRFPPSDSFVGARPLPRQLFLLILAFVRAMARTVSNLQHASSPFFPERAPAQ
eukprot:7220697-Pyramimonas_sp.AAC.1